MNLQRRGQNRTREIRPSGIVGRLRETWPEMTGVTKPRAHATGQSPAAGVRARFLSRLRAGWAIEPRNHGFGVPTQSQRAEGNISGSARRELSGDPARSKNLCMYGTSMRENREVPRPPVAVIGWRAVQGRLDAVILG
jgi:hypothetical protein